MSDAPQPIAVSGEAPTERRGTLITIVALMVVASLNEAIVAVAAPRLIAELHDFKRFTWIFAAYAIAMTIALPIFGRLVDLVGTRRLALFGIGLFALGASLCGVSWSMTSLAVFRGIQGVGAAGMMSMAMVSVGILFPVGQQASIQGMLLAAANVGALTGPLLGGALADLFGWRWCFYVAAALGGALFLLALPTFAAVERPRAALKQFDLPGVGLFVATVLPLLLGLSSVTDRATRTRAFVLLGTAAVGLVAFVVRERRAASPMLPVSLFAGRDLRRYFVMIFVQATCMFVVIGYFPILTQLVQGATAAESGILLVPFQIAVIGANLVAGWLEGRIGLRSQLALGFAIFAGCMAAMASFATPGHRIGVATAAAGLGVGLGLMMPLCLVGVQRTVTREELPTATTTLQLFRRLGSSIGYAVMGTLFVAVFQRDLGANLGEADRQVLERHGAIDNPQALLKADAQRALREELGEARHARLTASVVGSLSAGLRLLFTTTAVLGALSIFAATSLRRRSSRD